MMNRPHPMNRTTSPNAHEKTADSATAHSLSPGSAMQQRALQMQHRYGNQALQRFLSSQIAASPPAQRFEDPRTGDEVDIDSLDYEQVLEYLQWVRDKDITVTTREFIRLSQRRKQLEREQDGKFFEDPETGEIICTDHIKYYDEAVRYLKMIQTKELVVPTKTFVQLAKRRKELTQSVERQVIDSNIEGMDLANSGGSKMKYLHNVTNEELAELIDSDEHPELGYADPDYFERISKYTWRLKPNVSASEGIREFINPSAVDVTILECQATVQAVYYRTLLNTLGAERFDRLFGSTEAETPAAKRLLIQMNMDNSNPLRHYMEDQGVDYTKEEQYNLDQNAGGGKVSKPDHRPAVVGGWYYIGNTPLYKIRHAHGIWGGENALYFGKNKQGEQIYSGFGLSRATEAEMAVHMADEYNASPSAQEVESLINSHRIATHLSLVLPRLGDLDSVYELNLTDKAVDVIYKKYTLDHGSGASGEKNHDQALHYLRAFISMQTMYAELAPEDLLYEMQMSALDVPTPPETDTKNLGDWSNSGGKIILTWKSRAVKKTSIDNLIGYYADYFNVELTPELAQLVLKMNTTKFTSTKTPRPVTVGDQIHFPLPSSIPKLQKTGGGFQSLGSKVLSPDKIQEELNRDKPGYW